MSNRPIFDDFDRYCDENDIQPDEVPAAFAAFLNQKTGWDGPMTRSYILKENQ